MDDVDRRIGRARQGNGPVRRLRLGVGRPGQRVMPAGNLAGGQGIGHQRIDDRRVLAVDLQHPALAAHHPQRFEEALIGQAEVIDHERLGGRHARGDQPRQLIHRVVLLARDDRREPEVNRRLTLGPRPELPHPGDERG